jgi:hypothetical protein
LIVAHKEIYVVNSILGYIHHWEKGFLYPEKIFMEMRELIAEQCALYGIDIDYKFYEESIARDPYFVDPIFKEFSECQFIADVDKSRANLGKADKLLHSAKQELELIENNPKAVVDQTKIRTLFDELAELSEKSIDEYANEAKALLFIEKTYDEHKKIGQMLQDKHRKANRIRSQVEAFIEKNSLTIPEDIEDFNGNPKSNEERKQASKGESVIDEVENDASMDISADHAANQKEIEDKSMKAGGESKNHENTDTSLEDPNEKSSV